MESNIDLWDVVAHPDNEQTFHRKTGVSALKDTRPSADLRQLRSSDRSSGVSSTGCSVGGPPALTQNPIITHDLLQAEDVLPFFTIPDAYFDSLLGDENKKDGLPHVAKTPKTSKAQKQKNTNQKSTRNEREEAKKSLPPCNVCGAKSSGFHFGVVTCESCKVFYRRSLTKGKSFFCHRKGSCEILSGTRSNCAFCRLKKCHQVGMSKDGIKKGRYSNERRQDFQDLVEKQENEEKLKEDEEKRQKEEHLRKIKETIERLKNLHDQHPLVTPEVMKNVRIAQQKKKDYVKAVEEAMGQTPPISPVDATEFYKTTGIDITGYKELAIKCGRTCPQRYCVAVVEYLKEMDEYMSLTLPDRVAVLKGGFHDWAWISQYEVVINPDSMMTCIFCGVCFVPEQLGLFMTKEEVISFLHPGVILHDLELTDLEIAILRAFVFFDTSQCEELEEPEKVNKIQNHILNCLLYVLEENRGASKMMKSFGRIMHAFSELRKGKEYHNKLTEKFIDIFAGEVKCTKVTAEMFDLPDCVVEELETDFSHLQLQV